MTQPLLQIKDLKKHFDTNEKIFKRNKKQIKAVNNISFSVYQGETFGIVGESGCGKSTTGKMLMNLLKPSDGSIYYKDRDIANISQKEMKNISKDIQMVFQDPFASMNPRQDIGSIIEEPLIVHKYKNKKERKNRVQELLKLVGLNNEQAKRYPHQLSGGQKQRVGIARALALNPNLIIADEPVSALDVSIQSQILNLMKDLQENLDLTYIFIAHDLGVVRHISDRIAVMYLGKIVELADADTLYTNPKHPYTQALISAVPLPDTEPKREKIILKGSIPDPSSPPKGCLFHTRCPMAMEICKHEPPVFQENEKEHYVACHLYQ